jgi:Cd2+/Zn2+-exporting ATPase
MCPKPEGPSTADVPGGGTYVVGGVCCSTEEGVLRKRLTAAFGESGYSFNPVTCELTLRRSVVEGEVLAEVRGAGFDARRMRDSREELTFWERHRLATITGVALSLALLGIALELSGGQPVMARVCLLGAILLGGWKIFERAGKSALAGSMDMNVLMSVAVVGALLIDRWAEGAAVVVLFSVSLMLEQYSVARTRKAVRSLLDVSPRNACVLQDGRERTVPVRAVSPGSLVVVRPGERIPLDGIVEDGATYVNEAPITGESGPVEKGPGDRIFAGSVNGGGVLTVRVSQRYEETTLARIIHLIEEAHHKRAPVQLFVDRFARIYTPVVLALAVVVALVPPLIFQEPLETWFYRALVLLVIACPCALVISTPVSLVSALTNAAGRGILVKGGKQLETVSAVTAIAFDKTGTLTKGKPRVTDVVALDSQSPEAMLRIVGVIESRSEHHLAEAVVAELDRRGIEIGNVPVTGFEALPGKGVRATVEGRTYYVGNEALCTEHGFFTADVRSRVERLAEEGKTTIVLGREGVPLCILAARDSAREESKSVVQRLRTMGIRKLVVLSGDTSSAAGRTAQEVAIAHHQGDMLPDEKVRAVERMRQEYGCVAMVGDGINDAPALAASSVGIAMGVAGSDAALETADVILMSDDLSKLPHLFGLSRKAMAVIRQNIGLALGLKVAFLVLSVLGHATLWMAVLADDGAALAVIANGLRLLSYGKD